MLTPTPVLGRALRRLALTTKQAGKDYYKGTGSGAMGAHTKWGGYKVDPNKVRTYKVPDMTDFPVRLFSPASSLAFPPKSHLHSSAHPPSPPPMRASLRLSSIQSETPHPLTTRTRIQLTPFVAKNVKSKTGKGKFSNSSPMDGESYLARWKAEGGTS